jgi:hypothetical protein
VLVPDVPGLPVKQRYCVNTHMHSSGTPYQQIAATKSKIDYLGVDCIRDTMTPTQVSAQASRFNALDADVILKCAGYFTTWWFEGNEGTCVREGEARIPRLVAVEGMNEPYRCSGQTTSSDQGRLERHMLRIRDAAAPLGLDTYSVSNCRSAGTVDWWVRPQIPGIVNNPHSYTSPGIYPPLSQIDNWIENTTFSDSGRWAATEMGTYEPVNSAGSNGPAWQLVAGLHHLYRGAERFAFYELIDSGGQTFGFWSSGGAQRQSATAMHNFLNLLGEAKTAPLDGLTFSVSDPSNMAVSLSFRTASAQYVALWNRSSTATRDVSLNLSEARTAAIHRPVTTPDGEVRVPSTSHVVSLGDDPVVVRIG